MYFFEFGKGGSNWVQYLENTVDDKFLQIHIWVQQLVQYVTVAPLHCCAPGLTALQQQCVVHATSQCSTREYYTFMWHLVSSTPSINWALCSVREKYLTDITELSVPLTHPALPRNMQTPCLIAPISNVDDISTKQYREARCNTGKAVGLV